MKSMDILGPKRRIKGHEYKVANRTERKSNQIRNTVAGGGIATIENQQQIMVMMVNYAAPKKLEMSKRFERFCIQFA